MVPIYWMYITNKELYWHELCHVRRMLVRYLVVYICTSSYRIELKYYLASTERSLRSSSRWLLESRGGASLPWRQESPKRTKRLEGHLRSDDSVAYRSRHLLIIEMMKGGCSTFSVAKVSWPPSVGYFWLDHILSVDHGVTEKMRGPMNLELCPFAEVPNTSVVSGRFLWERLRRYRSWFEL